MIKLKRLVSALKLTNSHYVSIPKTALEMFDIQKGDKFEVTIDGDKIIYTKVKEHTASN